MFTDLYLQTTNPQLPFHQLFSVSIFANIVGSVLFHTIVYAAFFNLVSYIFLGKMLTHVVNSRLILSLIVIIFFGFFARFAHVKEVYKSYNSNLEKTREHLNRLYIGWIFIS